MRKHDALRESIRERGQLDRSFLSCKKELTAYGYAVGRISMKNRTVLFIKSEEVP